MTNSIGTALAFARLNGTKLPATAGPAPADIDQAYDIQDDMVAALDLPIMGWKIGATNPDIQTMLGVTEPFYGPLLERWVYPSPNRIPTPEGGMNIVETEFGFRMKADLPPRESPYSEAEVAAAVQSLHPALELVDRRMPGDFEVNANWLVADGGANHAFCYGPGREDWQSLNLKALAATVTMDGKEMGQGVGANALGGPLTALTWLANALNQRGKGLKAGNWVSTGTVCPVFTGVKNAQIKAGFQELGSVEVALS